MATSQTDNGIVSFGLPDTGYNFITGTLSGNPSPDNSGTTRQQLGVDSPLDLRRRWMVVEQTAGMIYPAAIVSTPLYDPKTEISSLALTALEGQIIAVQSRPLRLDPLNRAPLTGAWTRVLQCDVIARSSSGTVVGTATAELVFLDEGYALVGSAASAWGGGETPPTMWVKRSSWPDLAVPSLAVFCACKLSWTGGVGAPSNNIVHFRAPYVGWKSSDMASLASDSFAGRYINYT